MENIFKEFYSKEEQIKGTEEQCVVKGGVFVAIIFTVFFFFFYLGGDILASLGADGNSLVKKENG